MNDLIIWLRAQLDEDERIAQSLDDYDEYGNDLAVGGCMGYPCERYLAIGKLRVLAEVDAKRRILDRWEALEAELMYWRSIGDEDAAPVATAYAFEQVASLLALPYADRPGYEEAWRP